MNGFMWTNIALAERCLRAFSGFFTIFYLLFWDFLPGSTLFIALTYLASLYLLLTALISWDPLYSIFYKVTELLKITSNKPNRVLIENHQFAL